MVRGLRARGEGWSGPASGTGVSPVPLLFKQVQFRNDGVPSGTERLACPLDSRITVNAPSQKGALIGEPNHRSGDRRDACPTLPAAATTRFLTGSAQLIALLLVAGLVASVRGDTVYDQAQAAYGRADNATAFLKCVEVIEARPVSSDAPRARYLMEVLMAGKLRPGERRQVLEQLQPTRPWLAAFLGGLDAEVKTNWNQAAGLTLEFIAGAPDDGWRKLATAQLCRELPEATACPTDPATLVQAAIRLRQIPLRDCAEAVRTFAERLIGQNYNKPEAARLRAEWRRLTLTSENRSYLPNQYVEQIVADYLAAGVTNEAKQCAEELIGQRGGEWRTCLTVATAFMNTGDPAFAGQLVRRGIENQPAAERGALQKYLPEQQEILYRQFSETSNKEAAQALAGVWREGFLKNELRDRLVQEHYHLRLRQIPAAYPAWDVRIYQTFPFPDIYTDYMPTLYLNGELKQSVGQSSHAMSATNNPVASLAGGEFKNGDVLQVKVDLKQKRQWQASVWTNKLTLEGLKK